MQIIVSLSKRALNELANYKEVNLFLRGIVPMIGFKTDVVTYERHERLAGESKYPLKKMLALAVDGITSLSIKPIRFIVFLGFMIFMCSILMLIYSLVQHFLGNTKHWLDIPDRIHLGYWRVAAPGHRCDRRVYWQDLSGDQRASEIYY